MCACQGVAELVAHIKNFEGVQMLKTFVAHSDWIRGDSIDCLPC